MSETNVVRTQKSIAYVCNWCTYLARTWPAPTGSKYPSNVRIVRLPCTGTHRLQPDRQGLRDGARRRSWSRAAIPATATTPAGNYHARRRWTLFRELARHARHRPRAHPLHLDLARRRQAASPRSSPTSPNKPGGWVLTRTTARYARRPQC